MFLMLIASVIGSVHWIAGLAIGGFAWRRHRSAGLKLSLAALAGLTALQIISSSMFNLLIPSKQTCFRGSGTSATLGWRATAVQSEPKRDWPVPWPKANTWVDPQEAKTRKSVVVDHFSSHAKTRLALPPGLFDSGF